VAILFLLIIGIAFLIFIYIKVKNRLKRNNAFQTDQLEAYNRRFEDKVEEQTLELLEEMKDMGEHLERYQYALEALGMVFLILMFLQIN